MRPASACCGINESLEQTGGHLVMSPPLPRVTQIRRDLDRRIHEMTKHLLVLFFCLFLVMIGFGITLPIFAFYAERLAKAGGASQGAAAVHVGLLTGIYALMQFLFAPLWGRWSDRIGRKPLVLIGIAGFAIAQALFGLATSLWMFYGARIFGGVFSSAMFPAATAYVADVTTEDERSRGMAWEGTAVSLGVVFGPAFGGLLARSDLQLRMGSDSLDHPCLLGPVLCGGAAGFTQSSGDYSVATGIHTLRLRVHA
jgi:MFS transporter, DHA1 family, multidrug resistance protein